jgi:hypothetical protein
VEKACDLRIMLASRNQCQLAAAVSHTPATPVKDVTEVLFQIIGKAIA